MGQEYGRNEPRVSVRKISSYFGKLRSRHGSSNLLLMERVTKTKVKTGKRKGNKGEGRVEKETVSCT